SPTSISVGLMFRGRTADPTYPSTWDVRIDWSRAINDYLWVFGLRASNVYEGALIGTPFGATYQTTGVTTFLDGLPHFMFFRAVQVGANVQTLLYIDGVKYLDNTTNSVTLNPILRDITTEGGVVLGGGEMATSHLVVWDQQNVTPADISTVAFGYQGEAAGTRLQRICIEEGLTFSAIGTLTDSTTMGPQFPGSIGGVLTDCVSSDFGVLSEPRDSTNDLAYRTRNSISTQPVSLTLDYDGHQIAPGLVPIDDDQRTRNDWTVKRRLGYEYHIQQTTGPLSVSAPPAGVGVYAGTVDANPLYEADLPNMAGWLLSIGAIDESRWPEITVYLHARGISPSDDL